MNDKEWEEFIERCATQLKSEGEYYQVIRLGGAGDKGRDVCAYTQDRQAEGTWDLYQAKHYQGSLSPSEFAPELAKFLSNVFNGSYARPRKYFICALRVGPKLHDYIFNPSDFKTWILQEWKKKNGNFDDFKFLLTPALETFIEGFPFEIFKIRTPAELLEIHGRSDKHWEQFGVLGARGPNPEVPEIPSTEEQHYVEALLKVYEESSKTTVADPSVIPQQYKRHFTIQRRLFYSAEGLNRFSRDKLPGAFDDLVNQVELGIGSVVSLPFPDGMSKLSKALETANALQVTSNPLHLRLQAGDLQGTCHHLANQERITWVEPFDWMDSTDE